MSSGGDPPRLDESRLDRDTPGTERDNSGRRPRDHLFGDVEFR
jgi:hypothetical protein